MSDPPGGTGIAGGTPHRATGQRSAGPAVARGAGRHDDRDFDAYVRFRTPALLRSAYLLTGDQQLAEDLVQSALIRTHRAWHRVCAGNPDAYTRKVMYHQQIAWWRRRRVPEALVGLAPERATPDESPAATTRVAMRAALLRLTPKQRAVVVLRFLEDRTEAETASLLGVSTGTVKSQTARALARLRELAPELLDRPLPTEGLR